MGYTGSIIIIRGYIESFKPVRITLVIRRHVILPGKLIQIDWSIAHYIDERKVFIKFQLS